MGPFCWHWHYHVRFRISGDRLTATRAHLRTCSTLTWSKNVIWNVKMWGIANITCLDCTYPAEDIHQKRSEPTIRSDNLNVTLEILQFKRDTSRIWIKNPDQHHNTTEQKHESSQLLQRTTPQDHVSSQSKRSTQTSWPKSNNESRRLDLLEMTDCKAVTMNEIYFRCTTLLYLEWISPGSWCILFWRWEVHFERLQVDGRYNIGPTIGPAFITEKHNKKFGEM